MTGIGLCSAENELVDDDDRVDDDQGYCVVIRRLAGSGIGMRVRVFVEAGIKLGSIRIEQLLRGSWNGC